MPGKGKGRMHEDMVKGARTGHREAWILSPALPLVSSGVKYFTMSPLYMLLCEVSNHLQQPSWLCLKPL